MLMIQKTLYYNKSINKIYKTEKKNGINIAQKRVQKKNQKMDHMKIQKSQKNKKKSYKTLVNVK